MFKRILFYFSILFLTTQWLQASTVDYSRYVAIKLSSDSIGKLRQLNKSTMKRAGSFYSRKDIKSIVNTMNSKQMFDMSGENRDQIFHITLPRAVREAWPVDDLNALQGALSKVNLLATAAYEDDLEWGRFVGLRIDGFETVDETPLSGSEKALVTRLLNTGNLHVSLVKFLSRQDQSSKKEHASLNTVKSSQQIAEDIITKAFLKGKALKKSNFHELWTQYMKGKEGFTIRAGTQLDTIGYELDPLVKDFNLSRVTEFKELVRFIGANQNARDFLTQFIQERVMPEESVRGSKITSYVFTQLQDKYSKAIGDHLSEKGRITLKSAGFTNNTALA